MSIENPNEPLVVDLNGLARLGISYSNPHLLRMEADGRWPKRLSLGARKICWLYAEVIARVRQRADERAATAAERSRAARAGVQVRERRNAGRAKAPPAA